MAGEQTPQQPPRLSDMPEVGDLILPPDKKQPGPEELVGALPADLRGPTLDFMRSMAKNLLAQQTTGGEGRVRVTPNQVSFYKDRFNEILESGFLDPYQPPKKIT